MVNQTDLVLVRSDAGDGGWSLHAPGVLDEDIASGTVRYLASGGAEWDEETKDWSRPNAEDYRAALQSLKEEGDE